MGVVGAVRGASPRSCATRSTSPTGSTSAATSVRHPSRSRAHFDEEASRWTVTHRRRRRAERPLRRDGDRLPVVDQHARHSRARSVPRLDLPHRSLAPRGGRLRRATGRRRRHRIVGDPVDPADRRSSGHLYVFQRTAAYSVPARNRPLDPEEQRTIKADYADFRGAQQPDAGRVRLAARRVNDESALDVDERRRVAEFEARWATRRLPFLGAFNDLLLDANANTTAAEFVRSKIRAIVNDPRWPNGWPRHGDRLQANVLDTGYYETFNRPNVTLVDIRDTPIDEITRGRRSHVGVEQYELDSIVFATGLRRDDRRAARDRHPGPRRCRRSPTSGPPGRARTSASASSASRTCSRSPDRGARRCSRT